MKNVRDLNDREFMKGFDSQIKEFVGKSDSYIKGRITAKCFEDILKTITNAFIEIYGHDLEDMDDIDNYIDYDAIHDMVCYQLFNLDKEIDDDEDDEDDEPPLPPKKDPEPKKPEDPIDSVDTNHIVM